MAKRMPSILKAASASQPRGAVQGRPRVISGVYGYSPIDGFRDRRQPTPVELVGAYRQAAYACANLNASAFASTKLRLYGKTGHGQKSLPGWCRPKALSHAQTKNLESIAGLRKTLSQSERIEEITEHPILDLLDKVNPWMDRFQLLELTQLYQEIVGPAYWTFGYQTIGRHRVPVEIWPLPAWMVYPVPDLVNPGGVILEYVYTAGGGQTILPIEEVLYFKTTNLLSPYDQSFSPLRSAYENSQIYDKRNQYEDAVLSNRARPDALLIPTEDGNPSPEEIQRINIEFYQQFGMSGGGRVAILPGGYTYQPVSYPPKDMDIPQKQKATLHEIARAFGVPIPLIDVDSANRSILDAALLQHARFTIRPRCRRFEEMLNSNFCPRFDDRLFVAFDDPTPADVVLDRETDAAYFGIACRTPNEIRASQGLPPLPKGGDETYIPQGMVPLAAALDRAQRDIVAGREAPNPDEVPDDAREPSDYPDEPDDETTEDETEYDEGEADDADAEPAGTKAFQSVMADVAALIPVLKARLDAEESGENLGNLSNLRPFPANTLGAFAGKTNTHPCRNEDGEFASCGTGGGKKPRKPKKRPRKPTATATASKPSEKPAATPARSPKKPGERLSRPLNFQIPEVGPGVDKKLAIRKAAEKAEANLASSLKARHVGSYDPVRGKQNPSYDLHVPAAKSTTKRDEFVEVKYKSEGAKNTLSVHADAMLRKADHQAEAPGSGFHTVLIDTRDRSFGGSQAAHFSGHNLYYKRGTGPYTTNNMLPVRNQAHLAELIATPDHELPDKARGTMPVRTAKLEEQARKVEASRARRDADGKKQARREAYKQRKAAGLVGTTQALPGKP